ncbi:MAG: shikimate kinase [Acetivibrionales bacterium]|jgi:shikimate kinase
MTGENKQDYRENIILIGMPGAGKSTVGPLLASELGFAFVDTDEIVRDADGRDLKDIVNEDGLEKFLEIQKKAIMSVEFRRSVVATGGGVVKSGELMRHFKDIGKVIFLKQDLEILEQRLMPGRRLARETGQDFSSLYKEREPLYTGYADYTVYCGAKTAQEIVREILDKCRI